MSDQFLDSSDNSVQDIFDALVTAMVAAGWTTIEDFGAPTGSDKVLYSDGEAGNRDIYLRLTYVSGDTKYQDSKWPDKDPSSGYCVYDHILVRNYSYWNDSSYQTGIATANTSGSWYDANGDVTTTLEDQTGANVIERFGPMVYFSSGNSAVQRFASLHTNGYKYGTISDVTTNSAITAKIAPGSRGRRAWIRAVSTDDLYYYDFAHSTYGTALANTYSDEVFNFARAMFVKSLDQDFMWFGNNGIGFRNRRYALDALSVTTGRDLPIDSSGVGTPPVTNRAVIPLCQYATKWYAIDQITSGNAQMYSYSAITNGWVTETNTGSPPASSEFSVSEWGSPKGWAIPKEVNGTSYDWVLMHTKNSGTAVYVYQIGHPSACWTSFSGTAVLPSALSADAGLVYDGKKYLHYYTNGAPSGFYRYALSQGLTGVWTSHAASFSGTWLTGGTDFASANRHAPYVGGIRVLEGSTTEYKARINKDRILVSTVIDSSITGTQDHHYWVYSGLYDSKLKPTVCELASGATAGANVTVTISSADSSYVTGERVIVYDPDNGTIQSCVISARPSTTQITFYRLEQTVSANARLGADPNPVCLTGDTLHGVCLYDQNGVLADGFHANFRLRTGVTEDFFNNQPAINGSYVQAAPIALGEWNPNRRPSGLRGFLKDVYWIPEGQASDDQLIKRDGVDYVARPVDYEELLMSNRRRILFQNS